MKPFPINISENARLAADGQPRIDRIARAWMAWLQAGLHYFGASWAKRRRWNRELQELAAFSDRELWDLGLGRSDLLGIRCGTYRRD